MAPVKTGLEQEILLFPVSKVAEMFSISEKSVYRLLQRGLLESSSALRHKLITRASIERFLTRTNQGGKV
jgi:transposase